MTATDTVMAMEMAVFIIDGNLHEVHTELYGGCQRMQTLVELLQNSCTSIVSFHSKLRVRKHIMISVHVLTFLNSHIGLFVCSDGFLRVVVPKKRMVRYI